MTDKSQESDPEGECNTGTQLRPETESHEVIQPDGGWAWVVCFGCFMANGTVFGLTLATGILYVAIKDKFGKDDDEASTKAALVGSLCIGLTFCMCFAAGISIDKIGVRQTGVMGGIIASTGIICSAFVNSFLLLWLTLGVLLGVGLACLFSTSMVIISHYFKRRIGIAYGIYTMGGSVFGFSLSLGLSPLLEAVGFRYTMLILSSLTLITIPCSLTWKPLLKVKGQRELESSSTSHRCQRFGNCLDLAIWRKKYYLILTLTQMLHYAAYSTMLVHLVNYIKDAFPEENYSLAIMYLTITVCLAQVSVGKLADTQIISQITMMAIAHAVYGLIVVCIPWIGNYVLLVITILVMGVAQGTFVCLTGPLTVLLGGAEHSSQAFGFLFGMASIPIAFIPPLVGLLYDKLGSYDVAFHVVGCLPIVAMFLMCMVPKSGTLSNPR